MDHDPSIQHAEKPVPLWLALGLLGAIVIGGGALIWKYLYHPPAQSAIRTVSPAPGQPRIARSGGDAPATRPEIDVLLAAREAELADGVHPLPGGGTLVKAGDAYVKVFDGPADAGPSYSFGFYTVTDAQWEHGYLSNGVRRLLADGEYARSLGVMGDQLKKLEGLPAEPPMRWADEARERFESLYAAWRSAGTPEKPAAAAAMVRELAASARSKRAADDAARAVRVERIRAALTAGQVRRMNPIPRWDLPTTRGAAR